MAKGLLWLVVRGPPGEGTEKAKPWRLEPSKEQQGDADGRGGCHIVTEEPWDFPPFPDKTQSLNFLICKIRH